MKTKVLYILMVIGILAFSLSTGFNAYAKEKPIKIGFITDLTGVASPHGDMAKKGTILAMEEANYTFAGRPIELIIEDEAADPAIALDKARKLVESDKVCMLLGPFVGSCIGAVSGYTNRVQIPQLCNFYGSSNQSQVKAPWTWAPFGTLSQISYTTGVYAYEVLGYRTATTMATNFIAGREFMRGCVTAFTERGGKIIQEQWPPVGTKDVSPYLTVLKKADVFFAFFMGVTVIPGLAQIRDQKVSMPVVMPQNSHSTHPKIMEQMGDNCVGIVTSCAYAWTIDNPANRKFVDAFQKRWGELPGAVGYGGYAGVQIALAALKKTGGDTSPDALAKALNTTEVPGITGTFRFGEERVGAYNYVVYKQAKVNNQIVAEILGYATIKSEKVGDKLVHKLVSKSW